MLEYLLNTNYIIQALIATLFTWLITSLGALVVIFFKNINNKLMNIMLSISGGIMLSAAFFSLLLPAINISEELNLIPWLITSLSFILGCLFLIIGDKLLDNKDSNIKKNIMLITSITLHNIPEGMVIGIAFGSIAYGIDGVTFMSACLLTLGIAIQNFPEGSAISLPLRSSGMSRGRSFLFGVLSGVVEPISGVLGAILVLKIKYLLPIFLSFAAGAMIYVVIKEIIPEVSKNAKKDMSIYLLLGFVLMMILDVMLG